MSDPTPATPGLEDVQTILRTAAALVELGGTVIAAVTDATEPKHVQDVLPPTLLTSLARLNAELEAAKRFGPRG